MFWKFGCPRTFNWVEGNDTAPGASSGFEAASAIASGAAGGGYLERSALIRSVTYSRTEERISMPNNGQPSCLMAESRG